MVLPATSSVHHGAASSTTKSSEAPRPPSAQQQQQQDRPTSSPTSDNSMDYTTPQRFRNVSLPESSSAAAVIKVGDHAVTPSTLGPVETPDSVVPAENPVTASSAETAIAGANASSGKPWGTTSSAVSSSTGGAMSASERVKMNSRSCQQQQQHQQKHQHPHVAMTSNPTGAPSAAFNQITPSIKLGPRVSHADGNRNQEEGEGEMASPPPVMKLSMHRRGQSGQASFEELPSKKESAVPPPPSSSSSLAPPPPTAVAPVAAVKSNVQKQPQTNRFKAEHHQLRPPSFLAAKISPLRSKSSRAKKGDAKTRGKTPPPPPSVSNSVAAASSSSDVSFDFGVFFVELLLFSFQLNILYFILYSLF